MNELLYSIDGAPNLSDPIAARLVDNMIEGRPFASTPVDDFASAIDHTLKVGALHPQTAGMSTRYSEPELLDFFRRVAERLDARRPWPPKRFTKLDLSHWDALGDAAVIARVDRPMHQINGALGLSFDHRSTAEGTIPVLILQLRTGEIVALKGSANRPPAPFELLYRGDSSPTEVIVHFRDLTGFRAKDVSPI